MSPWLEFVQEVSEKRFVSDYLLRNKLATVGIVVFNVCHAVVTFLTADPLQSMMYPLLDYFRVFAMVSSISVLAARNKHAFII